MAVSASPVSNTFSMPGVLLTANYPDILNEQFDRIKIRKWGIPVQGMDYFNVVKTSKDYIKHSYVTELGLLSKNDDEDKIPVDHPIQGFDNTHTPIDYRGSIRITKRLRETDQFAVIAKMQGALLQSAKDTTEYIAADAFNTGFGSNASWLCADGMYLFDSARPFEDPGLGTWSNLETASALTQASLATMRVNFRKTLNERGLIRPITMKTLVVPPDLEDKAYELIKSDKRAEDDMNATNVYQNRFEVKVWDYLTSSTAYFGMGPKDEAYELYFVWRVKPETATYNASENPDVLVHRVRMSCTTGCDRPHQIRGNAGA
jgi:hypothetical protein